MHEHPQGFQPGRARALGSRGAKCITITIHISITIIIVTISIPTIDISISIIIMSILISSVSICLVIVISIAFLFLLLQEYHLNLQKASFHCGRSYIDEIVGFPLAAASGAEDDNFRGIIQM